MYTQITEEACWKYWLLCQCNWNPFLSTKITMIKQIFIFCIGEIDVVRFFRSSKCTQACKLYIFLAKNRKIVIFELKMENITKCFFFHLRNQQSAWIFVNKSKIFWQLAFLRNNLEHLHTIDFASRFALNRTHTAVWFLL